MAEERGVAVPAMPGSRRQLRSAIDNAQDMMFVVDDSAEADGGPFICYANATFARELGIELADAIGRSPAFMFGLESDAAGVDALRTAMLTMSCVRIELLTYRAAAGSRSGGTPTSSGGPRTNCGR